MQITQNYVSRRLGPFRMTRPICEWEINDKLIPLICYSDSNTYFSSLQQCFGLFCCTKRGQLLMKLLILQELSQFGLMQSTNYSTEQIC